VRGGVETLLRARYPRMAFAAPKEDAASGAALLAWESVRKSDI
jgi:hypothetical protein